MNKCTAGAQPATHARAGSTYFLDFENWEFPPPWRSTPSRSPAATKCAPSPTHDLAHAGELTIVDASLARNLQGCLSSTRPSSSTPSEHTFSHGHGGAELVDVELHIVHMMKGEYVEACSEIYLPRAARAGSRVCGEQDSTASAKDNAFFNNLGYAKDPTQEATRALFAADIMDWFDQGAYYYKGSLTTHSHVWGARGVACRQGGPESGKGRSQRNYCSAREPQQSQASSRSSMTARFPTLAENGISWDHEVKDD